MIEFKAERPVWADTLELYAREQRDGKSYAIVAAGINRVEVAAEICAWPKFLEFPMMDDAGQSLFNALWEVGYRPHNGEASGAHVEALKYHLEDMRKLVFKREPGQDDEDAA